MKKLLLLFFLFNSFIKAQVGFCPKGAQWHYLFSHWVPSGLKNKTITSGNTIVQNGDTIKVLYHDFFFVAYNNGTIGYTYIKQKGDTVFMKNTCTNNQWQVLYNFAAAPGQSWYNTFTSGNYVIQFTVTVNSVNLVQFSNKLVRQLNVTYQSSSNASYPDQLTVVLYTSTLAILSMFLIFIAEPFQIPWTNGTPHYATRTMKMG